MPPLPADSIHARACKLKCEKILTRPTFPIGIPMKVTGLSDESANSMYHFDISN